MSELQQLPIFRFDGFVLRPSGPQDFNVAQTWTAADPDHAGRVPSSFWITNSHNANAYVLEDNHGRVFFFKMQIEREWVEVHIQFASAGALRQARTRRGLVQGMRWLEPELKRAGFAGFFFRTINPQLVFFCEHHLGLESNGKVVFKKLREENHGTTYSSATQANPEQQICSEEGQRRQAGIPR